MSTISEKFNITPTFWGPYFWKTFHITAFGYPDNPNKVDKSAYQNFYDNFMKILPCDKCSNSAQRNVLKTDWEYILSSRDRLIKWTYDFHDKVNKKLGKKSPSFDDFINTALVQEPKEECSFLFHNIMIILLIIFILYLLMS